MTYLLHIACKIVYIRNMTALYLCVILFKKMMILGLQLYGLENWIEPSKRNNRKKEYTPSIPRMAINKNIIVFPL